jgi:hypothetical protein
MEVHGLRVLKYDGTVDDFPVLNGDVGQAELRASLAQRPGDLVVAVADHAYIRVTHLDSYEAGTTSAER